MIVIYGRISTRKTQENELKSHLHTRIIIIGHYYNIFVSHYRQRKIYLEKVIITCTNGIYLVSLRQIMRVGNAIIIVVIKVQTKMVL